MPVVIKASVTVGNTFPLQKVSQTTEPRAKIVVHKAVLKTWSHFFEHRKFQVPVFVDSLLVSPSVKVMGIFRVGVLLFLRNNALKATCNSAHWPVDGSSRSLIKPFDVKRYPASQMREGEFPNDVRAP